MNCGCSGLLRPSLMIVFCWRPGVLSGIGTARQFFCCRCWKVHVLCRDWPSPLTAEDLCIHVRCWWNCWSSTAEVGSAFPSFPEWQTNLFRIWISFSTVLGFSWNISSFFRLRKPSEKHLWLCCQLALRKSHLFCKSYLRFSISAPSFCP